MDKVLQHGRVIKQLRCIYEFRMRPMFVQNFCTKKGSDKNETNTKSENDVDTTKPRLGGFAQAFNKFETIDKVKEEESKPVAFASLLRNSKFIDLGDPKGKVVIGKIFNVVGNDLYIDFGWKFHCVCPKPKKDPQKYIRGSKVILKIKDLELSSRFLGANTDLTLREANCILLKLISTPLEASNT